VTSIARRYFGLRDSPRLHLATADARRKLESLPPSQMFDAVYGDAFNSFAVPYHVTTRDFDEPVARHLRPEPIRST
jgi:spermidine synthase